MLEFIIDALVLFYFMEVVRVETVSQYETIARCKELNADRPAGAPEWYPACKFGWYVRPDKWYPAQREA